MIDFEVFEKTKLKAALSKLEGEASALAGSSKVNNLNEVFNKFSSAYLKDPITSMGTICQEETKSVREYVVRFKIGVNYMNRYSKAVPDKQIFLYCI